MNYCNGDLIYNQLAIPKKKNSLLANATFINLSYSIFYFFLLNLVVCEVILKEKKFKKSLFKKIKYNDVIKLNTEIAKTAINHIK